MNKRDFISIAKVLGFHGVSGEVRAGYTRGHEEKLKNLRSVFLESNSKFVELQIETIRFHKKNLLIKFLGLNTINEVEHFKGLLLYTTREYMTQTLNEDEFLVTDLIGMNAYNKSDDFIGVVKDVTDNGATNILSIESSTEKGKYYLVPFVKDLVPELDVENKKILINDIEGLLQ